jgi:hypothetical protein
VLWARCGFKKVRRTPVNLVAAALARIERAARTVRRGLTQYGSAKQLDRPNDAEEWNRLYDATCPSVTRITSPIALAIEQLSRPGDVLLETGCGSATISAELAIAGRTIELADFSQAVLERARNLFERSCLPVPKTTLADLTKSLPWGDKSVDVTWSSGVLEHWTDAELLPIVSEMARISRYRVISLVPYAGSLLYRWGKWTAESGGYWPYGRELPRETLRPIFEQAGLRGIQETTIWADQAFGFLAFVDMEILREAVRWWKSLPADDMLRRSQGYLLLTCGEVS